MLLLCVARECRGSQLGAGLHGLRVVYISKRTFNIHKHKTMASVRKGYNDAIVKLQRALNAHATGPLGSAFGPDTGYEPPVIILNEVRNLNEQTDEPQRFKATDSNIRDAVEEWCDNKQKALKKYGDINTWDVTEVRDMSELFAEQKYFNDKITRWVPKNVTDMSAMFQDNATFNQDLNNWDVGCVTNMNNIFGTATAFKFENVKEWPSKLPEGCDMYGMLFWNEESSEKFKEQYNRRFPKAV